MSGQTSQSPSSQRPPPLARMVAVFIVATMAIGCLFVIPNAIAEDGSISNVPEPHIEMRHQSSVTVDDVTKANDMWTMDITDGDVTILLLARNLTNTQTDMSWIDYQSDINYHVGDDLYIAQITIMQIKFLVGDISISSTLDTSDSIGMTYTPVKYVGGLPTIYCNITYTGVDLQQSGSVRSCFDLTLSHHIEVNMTQTIIKVEARFDLSNTTLIDPFTTNEYEAGTPFAIEIPYSMMLTLPNSHGEPITPTGHTDTCLEYDLTTSSGTPITVSKLTMANNFTIYNQTGSYGSMGYSSMQYGSRSSMTHGFPNLVYKDTSAVQSDPEITIYHDSLALNAGSDLSSMTTYLMLGAVLAIVAAISILLVVRRKAKNK
jgi:hypothetical protein